MKDNEKPFAIIVNGKTVWLSGWEANDALQVLSEMLSTHCALCGKQLKQGDKFGRHYRGFLVCDDCVKELVIDADLVNEVKSDESNTDAEKTPE